MTTDEGDPLVAVRRQWADRRVAKYRLSQLEDLHWEYTRGSVWMDAPCNFLHGYVRCNAMASGDLSHSDLHGPCPHRVKVCIPERGNKAVWGRLRRLAAESILPPRALRHFRYPIDGPNEIEKAIDEAIRAVFGPELLNSPYTRWVRKLRRNGLIPR